MKGSFMISFKLCFSISVGFHVGFQFPGYGRDHHGKVPRGPWWVPCKVRVI